MTVSLSDGMLDLLACPVCRASLSAVPRASGLPSVAGASALRCDACQRIYPVSPSGIPHLFDPQRAAQLDRLLKKEAGEGWSTKVPVKPTIWVRLLKPLVRLLGPPSVSLNVRMRHVSGILHRHLDPNPSAAVLVIGGVRHSDQRWFSFPNRLVLDIAEHPGVQLVGDGQQLPLRDASMDGLISQAVLEHVEDSALFVRDMTRVLKPGGMLYCSIPFMQPYHSSPSDFRRYTVTGMDQLFGADFSRVDSGVCAGPGTAMARFCVTFAMAFSDHPWARRALFIVSSWLCFWMKYLDWFLAGKRHAHLMPAAVYFIGVKR